MKMEKSLTSFKWDSQRAAYPTDSNYINSQWNIWQLPIAPIKWQRSLEQTSLNLKVVAISALKEDSTRVNAVDGS